MNGNQPLSSFPTLRDTMFLKASQAGLSHGTCLTPISHLQASPRPLVSLNRPKPLRQTKIVSSSDERASILSKKRARIEDSAEVEIVSTSSNQMTLGLEESPHTYFSMKNTTRFKKKKLEETPELVHILPIFSHSSTKPSSDNPQVPIHDEIIESDSEEDISSDNSNESLRGSEVSSTNSGFQSQLLSSVPDELLDIWNKSITPGDLVLSQTGVFPLVRVPVLINQKLFDYQRDGVQFLYHLYNTNRGGILGDEMGLGKTIQAIAFVCALKCGQPSWQLSSNNSSDSSTAPSPPQKEHHHHHHHPFFSSSHKGSIHSDQNKNPIAKHPILIVCPASLLQHWHKEFYRWTRLRVYIAHGKEKSSVLQAATMNKLDVVLMAFDGLFSTSDSQNNSPSLKNSRHQSRLNTQSFNVHSSTVANLGDDEPKKKKHNNDGSEQQVGLIWSCVIFDEIHRIKNRNSKLFSAASSLNCNRKYGLTGTVMQNSLEELWTLCRLVGAHFVGDLDYFKRRYAVPIKEGHMQDASVVQIRCARVAAVSLSEKLGKFILRRTKANILHELPPKEDHIVFCPLSSLQLRCYKRLVQSPLYVMLRKHAAPCHCGSGKIMLRCCALTSPFLKGLAKGSSSSPNDISTIWKHLALPAMSQLQKLSNHISLLIPKDIIEKAKRIIEKRKFSSPHESLEQHQRKTGINNNYTSFVNDHDEEKDDKVDISNRTDNDDFYAQRKEGKKTRLHDPLHCKNKDTCLECLCTESLYSTFEDDWSWVLNSIVHDQNELELCGKLKVLNHLLPHWLSEGSKVLLFSTSTMIMDIIERFLIKKSYSYARIDGSTPIQQRQGIVDTFNKKNAQQQFVFLASTKSCGVGLNLSAANIVVIFEPHFNVTVDLQAADRAHRIGQSKITRVYRLVSAFSIEELTYRRQIYKQQMANIVTEGRQEQRFFKREHVFGAHLLLNLLDTSQIQTIRLIEKEAKRSSETKELKSMTESTISSKPVTDKHQQSEVQKSIGGTEDSIHPGYLIASDETREGYHKNNSNNNNNPNISSTSNNKRNNSTNELLSLIMAKSTSSEENTDLFGEDTKVDVGGQGDLDLGIDLEYIEKQLHEETQKDIEIGDGENTSMSDEKTVEENELISSHKFEELMKQAGVLHAHMNETLFSAETPQLHNSGELMVDSSKGHSFFSSLSTSDEDITSFTYRKKSILESRQQFGSLPVLIVDNKTSVENQSDDDQDQDTKSEPEDDFPDQL